MDYVVGSVAALVSGNVTPSRPKFLKRALTPIKHQPSPNVTPKSEVVDDRSIFLSPSVQKKKAIVKKSPKRIFQNPDLDVTCDSENSSSPKADKVKKHLQEELDGEKSTISPKKPKTPKKNKQLQVAASNVLKEANEIDSPQSANENTPKKKKKRKSAAIDDTETPNNLTEEEDVSQAKKSKKTLNDIVDQEPSDTNTLKKNKKKKKKQKKSKDKTSTEVPALPISNNEDTENNDVENKMSKKKKDINYVNPNAIAHKDTDSEHESDDEIHSENEEENKEVLNAELEEESSDDEKPVEKNKPESKVDNEDVRSEEEIKRTIFVGNVVLSKKCKKEIKNLFNKHGVIETVRIRTVPVKDARVTAKMAVIKNELHPDRTTVNVYVKFKDPSSVDKALAENNTVLNGNHLRVTRSDASGAEHDRRLAVFVGNVPFSLEDEALRAKFEKCGQIESVRIIRDKKTNAGKGFAYVNFASKDGVELALAMSEEDLTFKNRIMRVMRCTQLTHKPKNAGPRNQGPNNAGPRNQGPNNTGPRNQGPNNARPRNQGPRNNAPGQNRFSGNQGRPAVNQRPGKSFKPRFNQEPQGAERRLMKKRTHQDGTEGPPQKRAMNDQPNREKKTRKEFVGMTAGKKTKKPTFNKGQKKKKAISEILTKYS